MNTSSIYNLEAELDALVSFFGSTVIPCCFPKLEGGSTEEAEVEWSYEDLQGLLELTTKKMSFSI